MGQVRWHLQIGFRAPVTRVFTCFCFCHFYVYYFCKPKTKKLIYDAWEIDNSDGGSSHNILKFLRQHFSPNCWDCVVFYEKRVCAKHTCPLRDGSGGVTKYVLWWWSKKSCRNADLKLSTHNYSNLIQLTYYNLKTQTNKCNCIFHCSNFISLRFFDSKPIDAHPYALMHEFVILKIFLSHKTIKDPQYFWFDTNKYLVSKFSFDTLIDGSMVYTSNGSNNGRKTLVLWSIKD